MDSALTWRGGLCVSVILQGVSMTTHWDSLEDHRGQTKESTLSNVQPQPKPFIQCSNWCKAAILKLDIPNSYL